MFYLTQVRSVTPPEQEKYNPKDSKPPVNHKRFRALFTCSLVSSQQESSSLFCCLFVHMWFCLLCNPNAAKSISSLSLHFSLFTTDKWGELWWCLHVRHVPEGIGILWNMLIIKSQIGGVGST